MWQLRCGRCSQPYDMPGNTCVCVRGPWAACPQQGALFGVRVQHRVPCFLSCCAGRPWADRWLYVKGTGAPLPTSCDSWQLSRIKPARPALRALHTRRSCRMQQAGQQHRSGVVVRVHDPTCCGRVSSVWCGCLSEANAQHGWLRCAVCCLLCRELQVVRVPPHPPTYICHTLLGPVYFIYVFIPVFAVCMGAQSTPDGLLLARPAEGCSFSGTLGIDHMQGVMLFVVWRCLRVTRPAVGPVECCFTVHSPQWQPAE